MAQIELLRPPGLVASPAFSHVAVVPPGATTVYVGGQNAVDESGALVGGADVAAQTRQVMSNLATALAAAGAGTEHLVSVTVLLMEGVDVQDAYAAGAPFLSTSGTPAGQRGAGAGARGGWGAGRGLRGRGAALGLRGRGAAPAGHPRRQEPRP